MTFDFDEFRQWLEAHPDMRYLVQSKCFCPVATWLAFKLHKRDPHVEVDDCKVVIDGVHYPAPMWMSVYIRRFDKLTLAGHYLPASDAVAVANAIVENLP